MIFVIILLTIPLLGFIWIKRNYSYWADRNVPYIKPKFPYGNLAGFKPKKHLALYTQEFYNQLKGKGPFAGLHFFINPVMLVMDLEMIKNILVKDFNYFMNRGSYVNEKHDPLSAHLFNIEGDQWKKLRTKLTPTFTSGKMKFMFPTILLVSEEFVKCISSEIKNDACIELKEIIARFTTDVIGTCAFGIECNSLKNPNAKFREIGKKFFDTPRSSRLKLMFLISYPNFARKLRLKNIHDEVSEFFTNVVRETMNFRLESNVKRNDFMDLLLQIKIDNDATGIKENSLTFEEIAAQCFIFFLAGFETSSTAMSYSVYELALNQNIQDKARREVEVVMKKYNGEFNYDAMMDLKYIEQIINESLRKYPPLTDILRCSNQDYKDPMTGIIIEKGTRVIIPAYAIQHDPEYYPNPEVFDPDRFTEEMTKKRNPFTFLPFGEGPRVCIGLRFGMMQARIGLAKLLLNFKFTTSAKTTKDIKFNSQTFILSTVSGLWLNVEKI